MKDVTPSDCIKEVLILIYGLNKEIKHNIKIKKKTAENYYIINSEWMNQFKEKYNYSKISEELQKYSNNKKYNKFSDYESKISEILNNIKKIKINTDEDMTLKDIQFISKEEQFGESKHFKEFVLINSKIFELFKKMKNTFKWNTQMNLAKSFNFYFCPQILYDGKNYIEIGNLTEEDIFIADYYIKINMNTYKNSIIKEITDCKKIDNYFLKKEINVEQPESQPLKISNIIVGEIIILEFCSPTIVIKNNKFFRFPIVKKNKKNFATLNIDKNINENKINDSNNSFKERTIIKNKDRIKKKAIKSSLKQAPKKDLKKLIIKEEKKDFKEDIKKEEEKFFINITSFKDISITPMIGLENIGQTCYMNAALQCFSNSYDLTNYFLDSSKLSYIKNNTIAMKNTEEPQLSPIFHELIYHLWTDKPNSHYAPYKFKEIVGKINPLFKNFEANDAKDFVNLLL